MLKIKKIDHVAVCVSDIDEAAARWRAVFGLEARERETVASQKTDVAFLETAGGPADAQAASLELCAPAGNQSLERFLDKRGPGLHHICFEVDDLPAALASLKSAGVPLIDETPRKGARGHKVAFVHPKATGGVLVELVEPHAEAH